MMPQLDGRAWLGVAEAYGTRYAFELFESKRHPGYYHYTMFCQADSHCEDSKKPVRADGVEMILKASVSKYHGLTLDDILWHEVKPEELPLSSERVAAGE